MSCRNTPRLAASAAAAFVLLMAVPAGARAAPIDLSQSVTSDGVTVSGTLHGDLSGGLLTLNSGVPLSELAIDGSSLSGPFPPETVSSTVFDGLGIRIIMHQTTTFSVTVSPWGFDLGGTLDFGAGTASLTAGLQSTPIASFTESSSLSFSGSVDPNLGPVQAAIAQGLLNTALAALNAPGTKMDGTVSADWTSVTPGPATASLTQDQSGTTIDLAASLMLVGELRTNATLSFSNLPNFLDNTFEAVVGNALDDAYRDLVVSTLIATSRDLDDASDELAVFCRQTSSASRFSRISCDFSTALSFSSGPVDVAVPEPAALGVFGAGLAALAFVRRRRRTT